MFRYSTFFIVLCLGHIHHFGGTGARPVSSSDVINGPTFSSSISKATLQPVKEVRDFTREDGDGDENMMSQHVPPQFGKKPNFLTPELVPLESKLTRTTPSTKKSALHGFWKRTEDAKELLAQSFQGLKVGERQGAESSQSSKEVAQKGPNKKLTRMTSMEKVAAVGQATTKTLRALANADISVSVKPFDWDDGTRVLDQAEEVQDVRDEILRVRHWSEKFP